MLSNKRVKMNQNRCPLGAEAVFWNDVRIIARRIVGETRPEVVEREPESRLRDVLRAPPRDDALPILLAG